MKSCCDTYCANYGCNQGRDCPARKPPPCPRCRDMGYDASGQKCTCQPDPPPSDALAWVLGGFVAVMMVLMAIRSCA